MVAGIDERRCEERRFEEEDVKREDVTEEDSRIDRMHACCSQHRVFLNSGPSVLYD